MAIAGKCMEKGIDYSDIIDNSFYAKTYIQNQILGRALLESVLFYDGKCIFSSISREIMDFYGVDGKSLGGIVEQLRLTEGVEVAIFMYEIGEGEYKVTLRSKKIIDVAKIAAKFDGGGHVRAAGFSIKGTVHGIINQIGALIEEQVKQLS
jgi:phosphoesterase RecJ-like protein